MTNNQDVVEKAARAIKDELIDCNEWYIDFDLHKAARIAITTYESELKAENGAWGNKDDEYTDAINAAHPLETGNHKTRQIANKMVTNRHSKGALVDLVNWLLVENERLNKALQLAYTAMDGCAKHTAGYVQEMKVEIERVRQANGGGDD